MTQAGQAGGDAMSTDTLTLVGTYRRRVPSSLERIWENVMDWEHLPWLHHQSFLSVTLLDITADTWRGAITMPPADRPKDAVIEVTCDRPNLRYWSRTVEGRGAGTEIFTRLAPVADHTTDVTVEFRVPGVDPAKAEALGASFIKLYTLLWDQDETMMSRRQKQLDRGFRDGNV
jgi:hypothetical protein